MVPCLTHCCRFSYTSASSKAKCLEPLATFISRRLGKHQNLHVVWAQADLDGFITSSRDRLKQRSSQQGLQLPCVLKMFETGSSMLPCQEAETIVRALKTQARSQKAMTKIKACSKRRKVQKCSQFFA